MIAAKPTKIIAERCQNGIKDLKFAKPKKSAPTLKYQRPNHLKPGDQPTICDPLDSIAEMYDNKVNPTQVSETEVVNG